MFGHDKQEEYQLFVCNSNMTLVARGVQVIYVNVHYLCTIVCGVALRNFDLLSVDVENIDTPLNLDDLFKGLSWYFPHVNSLKKKRAKGRCYAARLIDLNEYFASFTGVTIYDKIGIHEINEILLNSMPNIWYK